MNLSIDLNFYINQIKTDNEKELLKIYYNHLTTHIKYSKKFIKYKKELKQNLEKYNNNNPLIPIDFAITEINNSIEQIENNAYEYKELFKQILFILINQK